MRVHHSSGRPPVIKPRNQTGTNITPTVDHTIFKTQTELKHTYLNFDNVQQSTDNVLEAIGKFFTVVYVDGRLVY